MNKNKLQGNLTKYCKAKEDYKNLPYRKINNKIEFFYENEWQLPEVIKAKIELIGFPKKENPDKKNIQ